MRSILEKAYILLIGPLKVILKRVLKEKNCKESFQLLREYFHNNEQNKGRNMDGKGHSDKVSNRKKEYVSENWKQSNPCYKVAKTLAEMYLCPSVL